MTWLQRSRCPSRTFKLERTDGEAHPRLAVQARVLRSERRAESAHPSLLVSVEQMKEMLLTKDDHVIEAVPPEALSRDSRGPSIGSRDSFRDMVLYCH
jgi:hypothetical protein